MFLSRILGGGAKSLDQERLILKSGLFDAEWYAGHHKCKAHPRNALAHFLKSNGKYDPSPKFSSRLYLSDNPDVKEAGLNPLLHFLRFGKAEGRIVKDICGRVWEAEEHLSDQTVAQLRRWFDERFYFDSNPDVDEHTDAFEHFMSVGWREGRDPAPWFSVEAYMLEHPNLAEKSVCRLCSHRCPRRKDDSKLSP